MFGGAARTRVAQLTNQQRQDEIQTLGNVEISIRGEELAKLKNSAAGTSRQYFIVEEGDPLVQLREDMEAEKTRAIAHQNRAGEALEALRTEMEAQRAEAAEALEAQWTVLRAEAAEEGTVLRTEAAEAQEAQREDIEALNIRIAVLEEGVRHLDQLMEATALIRPQRRRRLG